MRAIFMTGFPGILEITTVLINLGKGTFNSSLCSASKTETLELKSECRAWSDHVDRKSARMVNTAPSRAVAPDASGKKADQGTLAGIAKTMMAVAADAVVQLTASAPNAKPAFPNIGDFSGLSR